MDKTDINTDNEKRGKLLFLAGGISLAIFLSKVLQGDEAVLNWHVYMDGGIYFLISFIGLLWAFNFQVKFRSILYIFQSSFFVFSEILFVEFFFSQKFNRIYEAVILLLLLILMFIGNYVSFLMANVFNVDLFKKIPLAHVGKTSSYLISLLMIYFLTFSFLVVGFPLYILLPLILLSYILVALLHYINIGMESRELWRKTLLTAIVSLVLFLGVFLSGNMHEVTSIVPALGYYLAVSMVTQEQIFRKTSLSFTFSMFLLLIIFFVSIILNIASM
jgi:hypothetical protein